MLISFSLVFSFGLHAFQISHAHFDASHNHRNEHPMPTFELSEYMHLADKKLYTLVPFLLLAPWTFLGAHRVSQRKLILYREMQLVFYMRTLRSRWNITFEYLRLFFQNGILNPKVF